MEEVVNRRKRGDDFLEKGLSFHLKPSTLFREYDNRHLPSILNGGNAVNAFRHGMHGIHFLTTKRLVRKLSIW